MSHIGFSNYILYLGYDAELTGGGDFRTYTDIRILQ